MEGNHNIDPHDFSESETVFSNFHIIGTDNPVTLQEAAIPIPLTYKEGDEINFL